MADESRESTEQDDVTDIERGESKVETGIRLADRSRQLVLETR